MKKPLPATVAFPSVSMKMRMFVLAGERKRKRALRIVSKEKPSPTTPRGIEGRTCVLQFLGLCLRLHQTTIKSYYSTTSLCDNFDNFEFYWFANRYRDIDFIQDTTFKVTFRVGRVSNDAADVAMFASFKYGSQTRHFF